MVPPTAQNSSVTATKDNRITKIKKNNSKHLKNKKVYNIKEDPKKQMNERNQFKT